MPTDREELRQALHFMLNDVIEQGFQILVRQPQYNDEVNTVIKEATDELNFQLSRLDQPVATHEVEVEAHYLSINREVHLKSLELLSRLQKMQPPEMVRVIRSD